VPGHHFLDAVAESILLLGEAHDVSSFPRRKSKKDFH
jgi:hypothetical protein